MYSFCNTAKTWAELLNTFLLLAIQCSTCSVPSSESFLRLAALCPILSSNNCTLSFTCSVPSSVICTCVPPVLCPVLLFVHVFRIFCAQFCYLYLCSACSEPSSEMFLYLCSACSVPSSARFLFLHSACSLPSSAMFLCLWTAFCSRTVYCSASRLASLWKKI